MRKVLIVGGTKFIGRNLILRLLETAHWHVTLFNRGITNPELFPDVSRLIGDRYTSDIRQIGDEQWDVVVDLSCFHPSALEAALNQLDPKKTRYVLVSTCSVYDNDKWQGSMRTETAPILDCTPQEALDETSATYGKRKAECERVLSRSGFEHAILRPALVYGAHDVTVHLLAACPNGSFLEAHGFGLDKYISEPLRLEEGMAVAPNKPGHGMEFDWKRLESVRV